MNSSRSSLKARPNSRMRIVILSNFCYFQPRLKKHQGPVLKWPLVIRQIHQVCLFLKDSPSRDVLHFEFGDGRLPRKIPRLKAGRRAAVALGLYSHKNSYDVFEVPARRQGEVLGLGLPPQGSQRPSSSCRSDPRTLAGIRCSILLFGVFL